MFWIYIIGRLSIHLRGPSCEEVGNRTSQLPTTSQHHVLARIWPRNYSKVNADIHTVSCLWSYWSLGSPTLVGTALICCTFFFFLFLAMHFSQKWRRGRPSNLYVTFGRRQSFKTWPRELAHHCPNFYRGSKSAKFGIVFNIAQLWVAHIWKCNKISQLWNKLSEQRWWTYVLSKFGEVQATHPWDPFV